MTNQSIGYLKNKAIQAALHQDWDNAVIQNELILEQEPQDIATLNRLGFAFTQLGKLSQAQKTYEHVKSLDKFNPIAEKNLKRLKSLKPGYQMPKMTSANQKMKISFIEEPGKTKTVTLVKIGDTKTVIGLNVGTPLRLTSKKRRVSVETEDGNYVGCLPDDIGLRLEKLLKLGYTYQAHLKSNQEKTITVFIKEIYRSPKARNVPSFPGNGGIVIESDSSAKKSLHAVPLDFTPTGEEDSSDN